MAEIAVTFGSRQRMTWEQYWELPEDLHAEFSDGEVLVNPAPSFRHQEICGRLVAVLSHDLPDAVVVQSVGWMLIDRRRLRIPDVVVLSGRPVGGVVTAPPLVAVEVLSTNRRVDLVRKATEYLDAGAGQYWIVDPRDGGLDVFGAGEGGWDTLASLSDTSPTATIEVQPFGQVRLALADILA
jgi:Uma2 family endonuclease